MVVSGQGANVGSRFTGSNSEHGIATRSILPRREREEPLKSGAHGMTNGRTRTYQSVRQYAERGGFIRKVAASYRRIIRLLNQPSMAFEAKYVSEREIENMSEEYKRKFSSDQ